MACKKIWHFVAVMLFFLYSGIIRAENASTATAASQTGYIDVHMHLNGRYQTGGGPPEGRMGPRPGPRGGPGGGRAGRGVAEDYEAAAANLIAMMDRIGVAKAIVMPPPQRPNQRGGYTYQKLLGAVRRYPDRLVLAAGGGELNPLIVGTPAKEVTPDIRAEFKRKAQQIIDDGAKALGEMTALHFSFRNGHPFEQVDPDHPLFLLLADIAADNNVPIDLHIEAVPKDQALPERLVGFSSENPSMIKGNIPGFERLLAHNRKARIVWQHVGWDNTGHMTTALLRRLLEAHSNLYMALKRVSPQGEKFRASDNNFVDDEGNLRAEWLKLFGDFSDRFVIGADEFVGVPGHADLKHHPIALEDTMAILKQLAPGLRQKIGRENAARIYRL